MIFYQEKMFYKGLVQDLGSSYFDKNMGKTFKDLIMILQRTCKESYQEILLDLTKDLVRSYFNKDTGKII